jgi:uroporphyrinogen-III synthase
VTEGWLAGIGVLVTRPVHQAEPLARAIETAGGITIRFPTIAILPPADPTSVRLALARIAEYDFAIFVSPNAVEGALGSDGQPWPPTVSVVAVGPGTARALAVHGIDKPLVPARYDSEGLLALAPLAHVAGKQVAIFRGNGGRELLGDTLAARGARVTYVECYRRVRATADAGALRQHLGRGDVHVLVSTSAQGMRYLCDMVDATDLSTLRRLPNVVLNEAQAAVARTLGFAHVIVAPDASDMAILDAIRAWRTSTVPDNLPGNR